MVLEATLILVDNSEYSRNGDFNPSRWEAQRDCVNLIVQGKLQQNVESGVGLMSMGNKQCEVLATPSSDHHLVMSKFHGIRQGDLIHFSNSVLIGQLVLKHRINKAQKQQIICFICSPLQESENQLVSLAKKLKKNNVGVHIINIGVYDQDHIFKLQKFIQNVNSSDDNSYFLSVNPSSISSFTDQVISSPILNNNYNINQIGQDALQGVDDPELAMAIKMSLEEEENKIKQEKLNEANKLLQQQQQLQQKNQEYQQEDGFQQMDLEDNNDENELLIDKAKQLSLESPPQQSQSLQQQQQNKEVFQDPSFVDQLLSQIQGIDPNNKEIQQAIQQQQEDDNKKKKDNDEEKDKQK